MVKIKFYMWFCLLNVGLFVLFCLLDIKDIEKNEVLDLLKFTSLMPMLSAIVSYLPEGMHSRKRMIRLRYFVNSPSFSKFMFFWFVVFIGNMSVFLLTASKYLPERVASSLSLSVTISTVVFVVITSILLLKLITIPNKRGYDE